MGLMFCDLRRGYIFDEFVLFSFDFDWVCGRWHGLLMGCISEPLGFNLVVHFSLFHESGHQ